MAPTKKGRGESSRRKSRSIHKRKSNTSPNAMTSRYVGERRGEPSRREKGGKRTPKSAFATEKNTLNTIGERVGRMSRG